MTDALSEARRALRALRLEVDESIAADIERKVEAAFEALLRQPAAPASEDVIADLLKVIRWWAAQEDGIPDEVWGAFANASSHIGWSIDGTLRAASAPEGGRNE